MAPLEETSIKLYAEDNSDDETRPWRKRKYVPDSDDEDGDGNEVFVSEAFKSSPAIIPVSASNLAGRRHDQSAANRVRTRRPLKEITGNLPSGNGAQYVIPPPEHDAELELSRKVLAADDDCEVEEPDLDDSDEYDDFRVSVTGKSNIVDHWLVPQTDLVIKLNKQEAAAAQQRFEKSIANATQQILDSAKCTTSTSLRSTDWNLRIWALCYTVSLKYLLEILLGTFPAPVILVLGQQVLSCQQLIDYLPRCDSSKASRDKYAKCRGIYMLIGAHEDGRYAQYVGTTKDLHKRFRDHHGTISSLQSGIMLPQDQRAQYAHRILSQPGWTTHYRVVAKFDRNVYHVFAYVLETAMMMMLGTCVPSRYQDIGTFSSLLKDHDAYLYMGPSSSHSHHIPLNRSCPLSEIPGGRDQRPKQCACGATTSCNWFWANADRPFDLNCYLCENCYNQRCLGRERSSADQDRLELLRLARAKGHNCNLCQVTESSGGWRLDKNDATAGWLCSICWSKENTSYLDVRRPGHFSAAAKAERRSQTEANKAAKAKGCNACGALSPGKGKHWCKDKREEGRYICDGCYKKRAYGRA